MGLDMYLMKFKKGQKPNFSGEEVAYWRKANAIHNWIYENCARKNQHDYDLIKVTEKKLVKLKAVCEKVLADITQCEPKTVKIKVGLGRDENGVLREIFEDDFVYESVMADKLLPTVEGFFFGSTNYNDWYIENLKDTIKQVGEILENFDFNNYNIYYYASY